MPGNISAIETLQEVAAEFADAQDLIAQCQGKEDVPLVAGTPGLQALVDLLVAKGVIQKTEWTAALGSR